jgi:hypothetical protein
MNVILSFLLAAFISSVSLARHMQGVQREDPAYRASGNLVTFIAVPKDKSLRLYVVGKAMAEVQFGKNSKLISVKLMEKGKSKDLEFRPVGNYYEISGIPRGEDIELEMKAQVMDRPDEARISVDMP